MKNGFIAVLSMLIFTTLSLGQTKGEVEVDGLSCPFCALGLEKNLKKIDGLTDVKIDFKNAKSTFTVKNDSKVSEKDIKNAVVKAGFTPRKVTLDEK